MEKTSKFSILKVFSFVLFAFAVFELLARAASLLYYGSVAKELGISFGELIDLYLDKTQLFVALGISAVLCISLVFLGLSFLNEEKKAQIFFSVSIFATAVYYIIPIVFYSQTDAAVETKTLVIYAVITLFYLAMAIFFNASVRKSAIAPACIAAFMLFVGLLFNYLSATIEFLNNIIEFSVLAELPALIFNLALTLYFFNFAFAEEAIPENTDLTELEALDGAEEFEENEEASEEAEETFDEAEEAEAVEGKEREE